MKEETKENIKMFGVLVVGILVLAVIIWLTSAMTYQMFGSYDFILTTMAMGVCTAIPIAGILIYFQEKKAKNRGGQENPEVV